MCRRTARIKNRGTGILYLSIAIFLGSFFLGVVTSPAETNTRNAKLEWLLSQESDAAGYKVYYGPVSRYEDGFSGYSFMKDLSPAEYQSTGSTAEFVLTGLDVGQTYWVSITAYDSSGNESTFSNEKKIPKKSTPPVSPCRFLPSTHSLDTVRTILPGWALLLLSVPFWIQWLRVRLSGSKRAL